MESDAEASRLGAAAGVGRGARSRSLVFPDGEPPARPVERRRSPSGSGCGRDPTFRRTTSSSSAAARPAWRRPCTARRRGSGPLLVEREAPGGQAGTTSRIENYLGFPAGLSGADLARRAVAQATRLGAELLTTRDADLAGLEDRYRLLTLDDGSRVSCEALIVATGVQYRRLDVRGDRPARGVGVFYGAAITEAPACRGQRVAVVGGGNSAGQAAVYLPAVRQRVVAPGRARAARSGRHERLPRRPAAGARRTSTIRLTASRSRRSAASGQPRGDHRRERRHRGDRAAGRGRALRLHRRAAHARTGWRTRSSGTAPASS